MEQRRAGPERCANVREDGGEASSPRMSGEVEIAFIAIGPKAGLFANSKHDFGSHCVSCCFERWRALSERDRAGAAAEEEAGQGDDTIFRFTPCQNQKAPYFVAVARTEGASGEARLRDKARGEEKILIWNPL